MKMIVNISLDSSKISWNNESESSGGRQERERERGKRERKGVAHN